MIMVPPKICTELDGLKYDNGPKNGITNEANSLQIIKS